MGDHRLRIERGRPLEPSGGLDLTTSAHDGWLVTLLLTRARLGCALLVAFG
jgi:hypothetical protein